MSKVKESTKHKMGLVGSLAKKKSKQGNLEKNNAELVAVEFPNLKKSDILISMRISEYLLNKIKEDAKSRDIPYQKLIKEILYRHYFKK